MCKKWYYRSVNSLYGEKTDLMFLVVLSLQTWMFSSPKTSMK